jgi:hypothetical protein
MGLTDVVRPDYEQQPHPFTAQQNPHIAVVSTGFPGKLLIHIAACISVCHSTKDLSIFQNIHNSSAAHPEFFARLRIFPGGKTAGA